MQQLTFTEQNYCFITSFISAFNVWSFQLQVLGGKGHREYFFVLIYPNALSSEGRETLIWLEPAELFAFISHIHLYQLGAVCVSVSLLYLEALRSASAFAPEQPVINWLVGFNVLAIVSCAFFFLFKDFFVIVQLATGIITN